MHVKVINVEDVVKGADDLDSINQNVEQWLDTTFVEKDQQMDYFIKHQHWSSEWSENRVWDVRGNDV